MGSVNAIEKLIEQLTKFPGIGRRSASRIADHILHASKEEVAGLLEAIKNAKDNVGHCKVCNNLSEGELCSICNDLRRNKEIICVVENPKDIEAMERAGNFHGVYHVLLGVISPLDGKGPQDLKIASLLARIKNNSAKEVIIATDADTEGQITALYLTRALKPTGIKISRIGLGLPMGGNLEYSDPTTLSHAMDARREL
ncbi:MAG: recombination mediator RecR [Candidatus Omnitrophica bacterium]|nr:recombination mediator RecR [Candidatus Omnitrophota bacterium]MDD5236512.1 recombination mediator RecR [Candidatus Omnitrophota bacterium]MDD5611104.1 recombination mediator RecR [Candidatus Omnitrophota bacterium]